MQKELCTKTMLIALVVVILIVPLSLIRNQIAERAAIREEARRDIERNWSRAQEIIGPLLRIDYSREEIQMIHSDSDGENRTLSTKGDKRFAARLIPTKLDIKSDLKVEERYRGIYSFPVYTANLKIEGDYEFSPELQERYAKSRVEDRGLELVFGISDLLSVQGTSGCSVDGKSLTLLTSTESTFASGVRMSLDAHAELPQKLSVACNLELRGSRSFKVAPIGKLTLTSINSNWPHPEFVGASLPISREIKSSGFVASWKTSHFSQDWYQLKSLCGANSGERCISFANGEIGVSLYQPVDIYQKTERAIKYALLFITLTFAGFFLLEISAQRRIHPIQYALLGSALAVFYLLLLSLSEHFSFGASYAAAAMACVTLLTIYTKQILNSSMGSLGFVAGLSGLYAALYVVLKSEDYALLMGSSLIFSALTVLMLSTRNIDWYKLTENRCSAPN